MIKFSVRDNFYFLKREVKFLCNFKFELPERDIFFFINIFFLYGIRYVADIINDSDVDNGRLTTLDHRKKLKLVVFF